MRLEELSIHIRTCLLGMKLGLGISANSKYLAGQGEPLIRGEGGIGFEFLRMVPLRLDNLIQEGLV